MAKEKLTLEDLKVQSLVTSLDEAQMGQLKGGTAPVRGRFYTYRTRWTAVDVRSDSVSVTIDPNTTHAK